MKPVREGEVDPFARAVKGLRQGQVLRHLTSHGLMGPCRFVALARHQDELAVGDDVALAAGAVHPGRMVPQREQQPDLRHHHSLPERDAELSRGDGQQIGTLRAQRTDRPREQLGLVPGVGVGKEEELSLRRAVPLNAGPGLAVPARWQWLARHQPHPRVLRREPLHDRGGIVGAAVVHHQQLERTVGGGQHGSDHRLDGRRLVAGGDDHGNQRAFGERRIGETGTRVRQAEEAREWHEPGQGRQELGRGDHGYQRDGATAAAAVGPGS